MSDRDPGRDPPERTDEETEQDRESEPDEESGRADDETGEELFDMEMVDEELSDEELSDEELSDEELFGELDDPGAADPFTEMDADTGTIGDDVFEMVGGDETAPADVDIERDPEVEDVEEGVVVPKRSYCERCRHFSEPPTVGCTNPGTTIHELVDVDHFRVSNCPVVEEQRDVRAPGE